MEKFQLECRKRENVGTSAAKKERQSGNILGVVYAKDFNVPVAFKREDFVKILHKHPAIENVIIELKWHEGRSEVIYPTIVKDVQYDPVDDVVIHVDFKKISLEEKVRVKVPVIPKGEAIGIKNGGTVEYVLRELEVECLPQDIPESIEVDVSSLDVGDSIHVSDIQVSEAVKILQDEHDVLFTCSAHIEEEMVAEEGVEEQEPEVIKEKKKEAEPSGEEK